MILPRRQRLLNTLFDALHRQSAVENSLPKTVPISDSVAVSMSGLKTVIFSQALSSSSAH